MFRPIAVTILSALTVVSAKAEDIQAVDAVACSQRYKAQLEYGVPEGQAGQNAEAVITGWGIEPRHWGLERVTVVNNKITQAPALAFFYPKGSINPSNESAPKGGAGFYINGRIPKNLTAACLQYSVYFPEGFEFGKGGKLPGLYGGRNEKGESASGCRAGGGDFGFSTRYMWREEGAGSLYAYLPGKSETCGKYIGKGSWHFTPGKWVQLEQEVVLNTPGKEDGIVRVWVDGRQVISLTDAVIREREDVAIDGVFFVSFFGGKEPEWASPRDQSAQFSGVKLFLRQ